MSLQRSDGVLGEEVLGVSHGLELQRLFRGTESETFTLVKGCLAHKKQPSPPGPPYEPRYSPTVGS